MLVSLVLPLLQLLIIGNAFGGKIRFVPVALVDLDGGPEAIRVRERFLAVEANANTFRLRFTGSVDEAVAATKEGRVAAAVIIPENFSRRRESGMRPQLGLVVDNADPFVVSTITQKMAEIVQDLNAPAVVKRQPEHISLEVVEIFPYIEYLQYLLPGSITLAIFLCTLIGGGLVYVDDKARGVHEGYLVTPVGKAQLAAGMVASGTVKATIAGALVTIAGAYFGGILRQIETNWLLLLFFIGLVSFALISMISLITVRIDNPLVPRAIFGVLNIVLFFPSGAMYPIYGFPAWLKTVAVMDPFSYAVHGFRSILLKGVGLEAIGADISFLGLFGAVCFLGVIVLFPRRL
jgi:ABC-2 type transport system permease protein